MQLSSTGAELSDCHNCALGGMALVRNAFSMTVKYESLAKVKPAPEVSSECRFPVFPAGDIAAIVPANHVGQMIGGQLPELLQEHHSSSGVSKSRFARVSAPRYRDLDGL